MWRSVVSGLRATEPEYSRAAPGGFDRRTQKGENYKVPRISGGCGGVAVACMREEPDFSKCAPGGFEVLD